MDEKGDATHPVETRYANDFRIGFNRDEFILDVGQSFEGSEAFYWRIVCTPPHARAFFVLLQRSLEHYGDEYGAIPTPEGH